MLDYATPAERPLPSSVRAVGWLFIAFGLLAAVQVAQDVLDGDDRFSLNIFPVGILIGRGLLKRSRSSRTWALAFVWIGGAMCILIALLLAGGVGEATFTVPGYKARGGSVLRGAVIFGSAAFLAGLIWVYRVLTRPAVRAMFLSDDRPSP